MDSSVKRFKSSEEDDEPEDQLYLSRQPSSTPLTNNGQTSSCLSNVQGIVKSEGVSPPSNVNPHLAQSDTRIETTSTSTSREEKDVEKPTAPITLTGQASSWSISQSQGQGQTPGNPEVKLPVMSQLLMKKVYSLSLKFKKDSTDQEMTGPIYPIMTNSFVLFSPPPEAEYDAIKRPNGVVPVVVHPNFTTTEHTGSSKSKELKLAQKEGLKFLWDSFQSRHGCILAHEMGLGKTYTFISFIFTLMEQSKDSSGFSKPSLSKVLILAPKNVVGIWEEEFNKWIPDSKKNLIEILRISPNLRSGKALDLLRKFYDKKEERQVLLMSYDSIVKYHYDMENSDEFKGVKIIDLIICDEAHLLKNTTTKRTKGVLDLKRKERCLMMGLTGTPFQNNLKEFCDLIHLFDEDIFQDRDIKEFCRPIVKYSKLLKDPNGNTNSDEKIENLRLEVMEKLEFIRGQIGPVLQFKNVEFRVSKHEMIICVGLMKNNDSYLQKKLYMESSQKFLNGDNDPCIFYEGLDILKKICISPRYAFESSIDKKESLSDLKKIYSDFMKKMEVNSTEDVRQEFLLYMDIMLSGKIAFLFHLLVEIKIRNNSKGDDKKSWEKVVVASQSVELLKMVQKLCQTDRFAFKTFLYEGKGSVQHRDRGMRDFKEDDDVFIFLLSAKAGSVGLTLTSANHLVLLEPGWNPSDDHQAIFRIYRQGQQKDCFVYRLLCTGTIEEKIFFNQLSKEMLDQFFRKDNQLKDFDPDDISDKNLDKLAGMTMKEYFEYFDNGDSSYILDKLGRSPNLSESDNEGALQFAQEYSDSDKWYRTKHDLPHELKLLGNCWNEDVCAILHNLREKGVILDKEVILNMAMRTPTSSL